MLRCLGSGAGQASLVTVLSFEWGSMALTEPNAYSGGQEEYDDVPAEHQVHYPEEAIPSGSMLEQEQQNEVVTEVVTEAAQAADPMDDIF